VELVAGGDIPADRLITRVVPLAETASAFEALEAGGAMKILVEVGR
jgi:Zn-dependent alcohol dehydrogenase